MMGRKVTPKLTADAILANLPQGDVQTTEKVVVVGSSTGDRGAESVSGSIASGFTWYSDSSTHA